MNKENYDKLISDIKKELFEIIDKDTWDEIYEGLFLYMRKLNPRFSPKIYTQESKFLDAFDKGVREYNIIHGCLIDVNADVFSVTISEVAKILSEEKLLTRRNCGQKSLANIKAFFNEYGLTINDIDYSKSNPSPLK